MRNLFICSAVFFMLVMPAQAQLANWKPIAAGKKFPVNTVGQINGYARISQLKFHTTDVNKMYAVTGEGGLFTTTDGGANWNVAPGSDVLTGSCASVCVDYTNDQTIWLGTGDANYYSTGQGIYKSTNGGTSFVATTLTNCLVLHILQNPVNASEYVAATDKGIYKSTDAGASWVAKTATNIPFADMVANAATNAQTLYACTRENAPRFYRSTDYGSTWTQISTGITASTTAISAGARIAVTPANPNVVYLEVIGGGGIIHKSNDGGLTFTVKKAEGAPYITFYSNDVTSSTQGNYNNCLWVDNTNPAKLWLQSHNTWTSTDSGTTWTQLTDWAYVLHTDMHQVQQSPYDNNKLYSCNDGGIWTSTDGGTNWTPKCDGLYAFEIANNTGVSSLTKKDFVSIGTQDNARLYGDATGWYTISGGDDYAKRQFDYNGHLYIDGTQRQLDHTGSKVNYNLPTLNWAAFGFNRKDPNLAFMGYKDSLFRCTNLSSGAPTWTSISVFSPATLAVRDVHSCIADPNRLYILLTNGNIIVSTNALSATPTFTGYTIPGFASSTGSVVAMANNADIVYVAENNKVYRSQNGGINWTDVTYNLPSVNHRRIVAEAYGGTQELVMIGTNNAVYYKKAGQTTWTNYSTNLPGRRSPTEISLYDDSTGNARLRYATYGRAIWETSIANLRTVSSNFTSDNSDNFCTAGGQIRFTDISTGNISSWNWTFPGGSPSTSTSQNPVVTYATPGQYVVTLTTSDGVTTISSSNHVLVIGNATAYAGCTVSANSNTGNGFGIGISRFILGNIDNTSSINNGAYTNYACSIGTELALNTTYTISVTTGTTNNEGARVFIDYNSNGIFESGESAATFAANTVGARSVTFTTPASGVTMNKALRLRVLSKFAGIPSASNACDVSSYGQAEDYSVYFRLANPPSVSCSATANTNCFTPNGSVSATATNVTYLWNTGSTASSISNLTAGTYTVTVTDIFSGLSATCTTTVANNITDPTVPALAATATTICAGSSVNLSIASGVLNGAAAWQWYSQSCGGTPAGTGTLLTVSPSSTTTYYARAEGGCITPGTCGGITITVNNAPTAAVLSGTSSICSGGTANLQVAITGSSSPYTVVYSGGTVNNYTSGSNIPVTPSTTSIYTLTSVTGANGCAGTGLSGTATVTVTQNTFTGTGNWTDNAHWSCGHSPATGDNFIIGAGAAATLNTDFTLAGTMTMTPASTLDIAPGRTLTVSGTANLAGNLVSFKSDASGYGSLGIVTGVINGATNVTVERYIPDNGFRSWRLLSVPTSGTQTTKAAWQEGNEPLANNVPGFGTQITGPGGNSGLDAFSNNASMLRWTGTAWAPVTSTLSALPANKAYFLYVRGDRTKGVTGLVTNSNATTLRTNGGIYTGDQLTNLPANGFGLIGNLYPSAINFTGLTRTGGVNNLFYVWDSKKLNGQSLGVYQTFSIVNDFNCLISGGSYVAGQPNTLIESGQAFFVTSGAAGTITLKESAKISSTNGNLGFRPAGNKSKIETRLYNSSGEMLDAAVVVFDKNYNRSIGMEDAPKLGNPGANFAVETDAKLLAIEGTAPVEENDMIQFRMWNMDTGSYTLEFAPSSLNIAAGLTASLEDRYLQSSTALSLTGITKISFTVNAAAASSEANRFRIVFAKQQSPTPDLQQGFTIAPNPAENGRLNILFRNKAAGKYNIQLLANNGETVMIKTIIHAGGTSNQTISLPAALSNGTYSVEIIAPDRSTTVRTVMVNGK